VKLLLCNSSRAVEAQLFPFRRFRFRLNRAVHTLQKIQRNIVRNQRQMVSLVKRESANLEKQLRALPENDPTRKSFEEVIKWYNKFSSDLFAIENQINEIVSTLTYSQKVVEQLPSIQGNFKLKFIKEADFYSRAINIIEDSLKHITDLYNSVDENVINQLSDAELHLQNWLAKIVKNPNKTNQYQVGQALLQTIAQVRVYSIPNLKQLIEIANQTGKTIQQVFAQPATRSKEVATKAKIKNRLLKSFPAFMTQLRNKWTDEAIKDHVNRTERDQMIEEKLGWNWDKFFEKIQNDVLTMLNQLLGITGEEFKVKVERALNRIGFIRMNHSIAVLIEKEIMDFLEGESAFR